MDLNLSTSGQVELRRRSILPKKVQRKQNIDIGELKIKACFDPMYVIQNIHKFELTKKDRSTIAKMLLKHAKQDFLFNLDSFMPLCENTKIKIAKDIARDNNVSVIRYLSILDIQDEQERINLAKLEIATKREYVIQFIDTFKIQDHKKIIEILKDVAVIDKDISLMFVLNIVYQQNNLKDLKAWVDIMSQVMSHMCIQKDFNEILSTVDSMAEQMQQTYYLKPNGEYKDEINDMRDSLKSLTKLFYCTHKQMDKIREIYISEFEIDKILGCESLDKILKQIDNVSNKVLQDKLIKLTNMMFFVIKNNKEVVSKNSCIVTKLVCELIDLRSENLKLKFLPYVVNIIGEDKLDIIKHEDDNNPKTLACLYAITFDRYGLYEPDNIGVLNEIRSVVYKSKIKKNAILTQNILDRLVCLNNMALTSQERCNIIAFLCKNDADLKQNLIYLCQIISFGESDKLAQIKVDSKPNSLNNICTALYDKMGLNNDDLAYLEQFRECMYNNSDRKLLQYIGLYIIKNRHVRDMNEILKTFVNSVASKDRMAQQRYNTSNIKHLKELKKINKKLFEKWVSDYSNKEYVNNHEISITDDAIDLFLIGTEISGSCQNIDSVGSILNKCLMGYVMDGKNKACVIKDRNGRILARSIIRLLIDTRKKRAVLVKEPLYCVSNEYIRQTSDNLLKQKCIEYANWLGVSLVEKALSEQKLYPNKLYSLGSNVPYEYVDSAKNMCRNGTYEITGMGYIKE